MKNYDQWNNLKKQLDASTALPSFRERDVWWCSIGLNIGNEIDGKNATSERPVCIVKKFDHSYFFGVPLTSSLKQDGYSFPVILSDRKGFVRFNQGRVMSAKRLQRRLGRMKQTDFRNVKKKLCKLFS